jgi:hypothetical protein
LVDRALTAQQSGRRDMAAVFGRAAQGLLEAAMPDVAHSVAKIASRKGPGCEVAQGLSSRLTPATAAAVATIWTLRGARRPAVKALTAAFGDHPEFVATTKLLCRRVFDPNLPSPSVSPVTSVAPFEAAAPHRR